MTVGRKNSKMVRVIKRVVRWSVLLTWLLFLEVACSRRVAEESVDTLLATGWNRYRMGEYDRAVDSFTAMIEAIPESDPQHFAALYGLATTWNLRMPVGDQDKALAGQHYETIIKTAPDSNLAAWSQLAIARIEHLVLVGKTPDYDAVRRAYQTVIDHYPDHVAGHEAFLYMQATYVQTLEPGPTRQAAEALRGFIGNHPDSAFLSALYRLLATCYETLGEAENQLAAELNALEHMEVDPSNPGHENSGIYWRIAVIAEFGAGDFSVARQFYRRLIEEYPQDIRVFGSNQALQRMDEVEARLRAEEASL